MRCAADQQIAILRAEGSGPHAEVNKRLKALGKDLAQFATLRADAVAVRRILFCGFSCV